MKTILPFFSLVKFSHTIFSLPFAVVGFFMAVRKTETLPSPYIAVAVLLCLVFARNAAMSFNRYVDRKYDALNPRTKERELPSKKISEQSTLIFIVINCILFVTSSFFINSICFYLSPVALVVILGYSYIKRISWLCHFVLGLGLMIAPIGAYMAISATISADIFLLGLAVLFWVAGFDILYSIQDIDFDKENHLHSIPAKFGDVKALWIARYSHFIAFLLFILWFYCFHWDEWFTLAGIIAFSVLLLRQNTLIHPGVYHRINAIFFLFNGLASIVFCIFYLMNLL